MCSKSSSVKSGKTLLRMALCATIMALISSCGSSRQGGYENPDDMVDLSNEQSGTADSEDAEVLRLLGINPDESRNVQDDSMTTEADPNQVSTQAEEELQQLKDQLDKKDREITLLRTQLTQKESQVSDLEMQLEARDKSKSIPATNYTPSDFKSKYDYALQQYNSKNYTNAISIFSELLLSDSENSLSDNCQYWIGECYYGLRNYQQAIAEFEKVFSFTNANKADAAQLKLGICYMKLGDSEQARAEFDRLLANYPNSEFKSTAENYLARL